MVSKRPHSCLSSFCPKNLIDKKVTVNKVSYHMLFFFQTGRNRNNINAVRHSHEKWMKEQCGTIRSVKSSSIRKTASVPRRLLGFFRRSSYTVMSRFRQGMRCVCQIPHRLLYNPVKWSVRKTKHLYRKLTLRNELTVK